MSFISKLFTWGSFLFALVIQVPVQAAMVETSDLRLQYERVAVVSLLERNEVKQQLMNLGVDQATAMARVNQMTHEEIKNLNGQITQLPAGAGMGTTNLLLIIILLVLLI